MNIRIQSKDPIWDLTLGAYLRKAGHTAIWSGAPADVDPIGIVSPDVLILDLEEGVSATDAVHRVRRSYPDAPVLLVARRPGVLSAEQARRIGVRALLRKPLSFAELDLALDTFQPAYL